MTEIMSREAAETVTTEIRDAGKVLATARTKFASAVKRAKDGQAHEALGYASWPEYVATVFADMPGLGKADREYLTGFMAGEGMSTRAIARVIGVSQATASRMVRALEESGDVDSDREVEGTDGVKQGKGKGKGRAKGKGKGKPAEAGTTTVKTAKTEELRTLATAILEELSDRWNEGDEAAEAAYREISDLVAIAV